jgi:Mg2+ and Co2+ transporter CorA
MKDGIDESASLKKKFNVLHENFLDLSNNEKLELLKTLTLKYK